MRSAGLNMPTVAAIYCCAVKMVNETVESVFPYTDKTDNFAVTETGCQEMCRPDFRKYTGICRRVDRKNMDIQNGQY